MSQKQLFLRNIAMAIVAVLVGLFIHPGLGIALAVVFLGLSLWLSRRQRSA